MPKDQEVIKGEIEDFVNNNGGNYDDYYIGITNDLDRRVVESRAIFEHIESGRYTEGNPIYKEECNNRNEAVKIEQSFQGRGMLKLNKSARGAEDSRFIYCFKMDDANKAKVINENLSETQKMRKSMDDFKKFGG